MSFPPCSPFGEKSLTVQAALTLACAELGISETEQAKRETVAILMAPLAKSGPVSIDRLKTFAVFQFRAGR